MPKEFRCYKYDNKGYHNGYVSITDLKELAKFVCQDNSYKMVTDTLDLAVFDTLPHGMGRYLNRFYAPYREFRNEFIEIYMDQLNGNGGE